MNVQVEEGGHDRERGGMLLPLPLDLLRVALFRSMKNPAIFVLQSVMELRESVSTLLV